MIEKLFNALKENPSACILTLAIGGMVLLYNDMKTYIDKGIETQHAVAEQLHNLSDAIEQINTATDRRLQLIEKDINEIKLKTDSK